MATNQNTVFLYESTPSTTQSDRRQMADGLRGIFPQDCPLMFAIDVGAPVKNGPEVTIPAGRPGRIAKSSAGGLRVEASVWVGADEYKEVTEASGLTLTFADVLDMTVNQKWYNPKNETQGIIATVNASPTNTCVFVSCGATAFSAEIGDKLIPCATAYQDNYSSINYYQHAEDLVYNVMNTYGLGFEMGKLRKMADFFISNYYSEMRKQNWNYQLRGIERDFIWGIRPSTANVTTVGSAAVHHSNGLWQFAQNSIECMGPIDKTFLFTTLPNKLPKCIGGDDKILGLVSMKAFSQIQNVVYDKWFYTAESGPQGRFGIQTNRTQNGRCEIFWMAHPAFSYGAAESKGLLLVPDTLEYKYHEGADFEIMENVQPKEQGGQKDIITGTCCILPRCGGYKLVKLTDIAVG